MKKIIGVLILLVSGLAFSQQTIILEDQCNCEVLSGSDVTASGTATFLCRPLVIALETKRM